ncbi:MAG: hypothetical protein QF619_10945 [Candidatus Binatia bacterium]|jgi:pyruvate/2-oxoacid:ferredoxin oxidoreductase beta subunit|nr:hypothetical protein [Candidatus Binatia bacterium]|tara:strand:+ start:259 stop:438 length:180 start_codon:yes stop_codon:yes gene_type:complete
MADMKDLIIKGIEHPGFSFIKVLTSCSAFNTTDMNVARIIRNLGDPYRGNTIVKTAQRP